VIVFTATDQVSGKVFAGNTRHTLEVHWDNLLTQEAEGAMGEFFETLRKSGVESFKIEEWGYSDNPKELREMLAEAMDDLNALPIKPVLGTVRKAEAKAANAVLKELEELKLAMKSDDDDFDPVVKTSKSERAEVNTSATVITPSQKEVPINSAETKAALSAKPLRHTRSTEEAAEMRALIAGIEARRRANLKSNRRVPTKKKVVAKASAESDNAGAVSAEVAVNPKLPEGRTSSSAKEKRIREAIASQKAEMEAQKRDKAADEAKEMRDIMARLDERAKSAARIHRRM